MPDDLLAQIRQDLMPTVASYGFEVIEHQDSASFGNSIVVLQVGDLRVRIVRDRSQIFVDFGSVAEPGSWFDSAVVMDYLGLSEEAGFHSRDAHAVLLSLGSFIRSFWKDLSLMFGGAAFPATRKELISLREGRAAKRFGN